jgi:hypothetical protein
MLSSASENSKYDFDENEFGDVKEWKKRQKTQEKVNYLLNTQFGADYNLNLKQWYDSLMKGREDLIRQKDLEKSVNIEQFRLEHLKDKEYGVDGLLEGWTLHAGGV